MNRRQFVGAALMVPLQQSMASSLFGASKLLDATGLAPHGARVRSLRATGLIITDPVTPTPAEACTPTGFDRDSLVRLNGLDHTCYESLRTPDYFLPPPNMDPGPNQGSDENEGRVADVVRLHAQLKDPKKILINAVLMALGMPVSTGPPALPATFAGDPTLASVLAQVAVTGRTSFDAFKAWTPKDADLVAAVLGAMPRRKFDSKKLQAAASAVLDAAYTAAWATRANVAGWRARRATMGWIATSGEDDLPHRPINIPTGPFPQFDLLVNVTLDDGTQFPVQTRYMVTTVDNRLDPATAPAPLPAAGTLRSLPDDTAQLPADPKLKFVIFLPGGGSRAEECVGFAEKLIKAGSDRGQSYAVISLDLPNSGYSTPFDHTKVAAASDSFRPDAAPAGPAQPMATLIAGYPLLEFEERFIISFIETLDRQFGHVKNRIVVVMGGSLGGNMSLQLARRSGELPYLGTIVAWSSTCFSSINDLRKFMVGHQFAGAGGDMIGRFQEVEQPSTRHEWFKRVCVDPLADPGRNAVAGGIAGAIAGTIVLGPAAGATAGTIIGLTQGMPPQPTMWYSDAWQPCKLLHIVESRLDRFEYYTPEHRRWNDRLNYEMALFSFQEADVYPGTQTQGPARYLTMTARLLLAAGADDDYKNVQNYSMTRSVAKNMVNTPGRTLFLLGTGHSIHAECPIFFSREIVKFLVDGNGG